MTNRPTDQSWQCSRCGVRTTDPAGWSITVREGRATGTICPACTTLPEHAEAEMWQAYALVSDESLDRAAEVIRVGPSDR